MRILSDPKLDFDDVLILPKRSTLTSRADVDISRKFKFRWSHEEWDGVPVFAANMDRTGTIEMASSLQTHKMPTAIHKHYDENTLVQLFSQPNQYIWYSLGITERDWDKFQSVKSRLQEVNTLLEPIKYICVDVANGYTEAFVSFIQRLREDNEHAVIMAGNVVTPDITEQLIIAGADIVKVGIGPGSTCITRKVTGIGYPQLSAIIECADAAHGLKGLVCGDGGCKVPGDVVKAFAAGADFVMLGGMLAGTDESCGDIISNEWRLKPGVNWDNSAGFSPGVSGTVYVGDKQYVVQNNEFANFLTLIDSNPQGDLSMYTHYMNKFRWAADPGSDAKMEFYGMSSYTAQDKHSGYRAAHRASEGKRVLIPYRGPVAGVVKEVLGGIRSACTYVGAVRLKELSKRATFVLVSKQRNTVFDQYDA